MNKLVRRLAFAPLAMLLFFSCKTVDFKNLGDDKIIEKGISAWNDQEPEAARYYWTNIKEVGAKKTYLGYLNSFNAAVKDTAAVLATPPDNETKYLAAYQKLHKTYSSLPDTLELPSALCKQMTGMATFRAKALLGASKNSAARDLLKSAEKTYGGSPEITLMLAEVEILVSVRKTEDAADDILALSRSNDDFNGKITGYQRAIGAFAKAETELDEKATNVKFQDASSVIALAGNLKKKKQDAKLEMERKLRERQYSFKDRIGEEFARVPEGDKLGSMSLEEILAFQESIKANVEQDYAEMKDFNELYPAVIDKGMMADVEDQKRTLETKIAQVTAEIRTAKDIASRGKTVMPIMIGLFNSVPGGKPDDQKSRPGVMRGTIKESPDYWWGMVSIPANTLNDLVITMDDERTVRVYPENTKSGSLVKNMKDLVNRGYKVGNSWPVLNAGSQLPSGKYFVEVQKGKKQNYEGEAVIYSSFIMRMR
jgi:hypothetical protein